MGEKRIIKLRIIEYYFHMSSRIWKKNKLIKKKNVIYPYELFSLYK